MSKKFENARLVVAAITGSVYIAEVSKKDGNCMTDTRREVPKGEFIAAIVDWYKSQTEVFGEDGEIAINEEAIITVAGKPKYKLKLEEVSDAN